MTKLKRCPYIQCYTNISYSIMSLPLGFLLHTVSSRSFVDVEFARLEDSRKRVPSSCQSSSERLWMYLVEVPDYLVQNVPSCRLWRFNILWQKSCTCQSLIGLFSVAEAFKVDVCCLWSFGPFASHWFDWVNLEDAAIVFKCFGNLLVQTYFGVAWPCWSCRVKFTGPDLLVLHPPWSQIVRIRGSFGMMCT